MIGHNANEGLAFMLREALGQKKKGRYSSTFLPAVPRDLMHKIGNDIYPPPGAKTPYKTEEERVALFASELLFTCNTRFLSTAWGNETYNYRFQVMPAMHGMDLMYTFQSSPSEYVISATAKMMQRYFVRFAHLGSPNAGFKKMEKWPQYGSDAQLLTFGSNGAGLDVDYNANPRCEYWQKAEYRNK